MFYLVNPSDLPSRRRKNPELLIVNPYTKGDKQKPRRNKMAKLRRRNPIVGTVKKVLSKDSLIDDAVVGFGGGVSLAVATLLVGQQLGVSKAAQVAVAAAGGVIGAVAVDKIGELAKKPAVSAAAPKVAQGAIAIGLWELFRDPILAWIDSLHSSITGSAPAAAPAAATGTAGWGSWTKEFDGLGQSYHDEFAVQKGVAGLGAGPNPLLAAGDNPFLAKGMGAYEPLGDIVNAQRLGAFESESGIGSFSPENANVRDQQIADQAKYQAGYYGGLGDASNSTLFVPFIQD